MPHCVTINHLEESIVMRIPLATRMCRLFVLGVCLLNAVALFADFEGARRAFLLGKKAEAIREFKSLADSGDVKAMNMMGSLCESGDGIPKNLHEAVRYYMLAAGKGDTDSKVSLAMLYEQGVDGKPDAGQAIRWLSSAALDGNLWSQSQVGALYANLPSPDRNLVLAYTWLNLSASQGDTKSAELRDRIAAEMHPVQISAAQQLTSDIYEALSNHRDPVSDPRLRAELQEGCSPDSAALVCGGDAAFFRSLSLTILCREPSAEDICQAEKVLGAGKTRGNFLREFFGGTTYRRLNRSDSEFTQDVYKAVLGRICEPQGLTFWGKWLKDNANKPDVRLRMVDAIMTSKEYIEILPSRCAKLHGLGQGAP